MYYIYTFLDITLKVIYIGITDIIEIQPKLEHFTLSNNLDQEGFREVVFIKYSECNNLDDALIKARYLINIHSPKYNKDMKNNSKFNFVINDFKWEAFPLHQREPIKEAKEEKNTISKTINLPVKYKEYNDGVLLPFVEGKNTPTYLLRKWPNSMPSKSNAYNINYVNINSKYYFFLCQIKYIADYHSSINLVQPIYLVRIGRISANEVLVLHDYQCIKNNLYTNIYKDHFNTPIYPKETKLATIDGTIKFCAYLVELKNQLYDHDAKKLLEFLNEIRSAFI